MKKGIMIGGAVVVGFILLIVSDVLTITTRGCSLPIDLVMADTCLFGSLGMTLGLTLLAAIVFGVIGLIFAVLKNLFRYVVDLSRHR